MPTYNKLKEFSVTAKRIIKPNQLQLQGYSNSLNNLPVTQNLPELNVNANVIQPKEVWNEQPNSIRYNMNGRQMFGTEDQLPILFKSDYDVYRGANVSEDTIPILLAQKYGIKKLGTSYTPDDATQKAINVRTTNLYKK